MTNSSGRLSVITSPKTIQSTSLGWQKKGERVGLVPTMGCLHAGHMSLVHEAKKHCDRVIVWIFVNPLQFGKNEDFSRYPRTFADDRALCEKAGVDAIFYPSTNDIYPRDFQTRLMGGQLTRMYCGKSRPGHFDGVLTVVNKFFQIIQPNVAYFGEKDFQQLFLMKQMVKDFVMPIDIVGVPTLREESGLAMSSRNTYLSAEQREHATAIYQAINMVQKAHESGIDDRVALEKMAREKIASAPGMTVDYVHFVHEKTLEPQGDEIVSPARMLVAAFIGESPRARLIDNARI